ncbi:unnamed protein product [Notodromas monacha]|uniref:Lactosylceramide 4-alpha-galactosyltransferase n=1 Tax=Notodromas monacha TaxID=399045 RepID=A0A7R9BFE5_9CRUS|nr:unnamed protein product [Notodromas monacha]CAG0914411.1 unnamed protein product [Notodromas monacha]
MPMLSPKELCAIESAALHHPHRPVVVAVNHKYLQLPTSVAKWAKIYPNVIFTQLDINKWLEGTVLLPWLSKGLLDRSLYKISHTSDILRFATMYKYGGLYMDTDVIVLRSMDDLGNAVGLQEYTRQGAVPGIMSFRKHHPIMAECLEELVLRSEEILFMGFVRTAGVTLDSQGTTKQGQVLAKAKTGLR